MRAHRFRPRPLTRVGLHELDASIHAMVRNRVGALCGDRGEEAVSLRMVTNPCVRAAYGLDPLPGVDRDREITFNPFDPDEVDEPGAAAAARRGIARDRARIAAYWARNGRCERVPWAEGQVGRAIRLVGRTLGFTRIDTEIVQLAIACSVSNALAALFGLVRLTRREEIADLVSTALGRSAPEVRSRLAALAPVFATGLVQLHGDMEPYPGWMIRADPRLISLVREGGVRRDRLLARFLTPEPAPTLALDDFAHLRLDLDAVRRILDSALAKPRPGVNVLFYGPSGVGKTEVARILAADLGAELFAAGAADDDGDSLTAKERLASLRVGHRMLTGVRAVMLWDELEDLDPARPWEQDEGSTRPGKLWLNQLLERNSTPTIWISNSLDALDAAYVRRFTFKLRFPSLGAAQRRRVWTRVAARELTDAEIDERAFAYDLSPGEIASAAEAARAAGLGAIDLGVLDRTLAGAVRATGRRPAAALRAGAEYRLDAVNASVNVVRLVEALCDWRPGAGAGVSLCLYGRPGTGKSELVAYLAKRMARPLVARRVSDLVSMWVGETEQNIVRAFEEAEQEGAVLLLDECDSFLRDRRFAHHSWERTQVNELLQQIEAFRGVVACTTNLFGDLDQAVLRRFVHKVEFFPLLPEQAVVMWDAHLARFLSSGGEAERTAIAQALRRIPGITPGDFAVVARRVAQLGGTWTAVALLRELETEVAARGDERRPIGF